MHKTSDVTDFKNEELLERQLKGLLMIFNRSIRIFVRMATMDERHNTQNSI